MRYWLLKSIRMFWPLSTELCCDIIMFYLQLFAQYCGSTIKSHPWSELEGLQPETAKINTKLVDINTRGFLTINSQPSVNGEKSDSPTFGNPLVRFMYLKILI